ncbi:MAG: L-threonylcarbamoyladenylate synthase, partial [Oscillospiraceae bacterium]
NEDMLNDLVSEVPETAKKLMDTFWPGPLTIILKRTPNISDIVTAGLDTVGVRMPENPVARELIALAEVPIAAPSANLSGKPSPTTAKHVIDDMEFRVDAIIDGGDCTVGVESTVIDLSGKLPRLFRPGGVTLEQLEQIIGKVHSETTIKDGEKPKSPGLKYKHYAPKAQVIVLHGNLEQVKKYVNNQAKTKKVGLLVFDEFLDGFENSVTLLPLGSSKNPRQAAKALFKSLREMDEHGVEVIFAPEIPDSGMWSAVKNRLYRAAAENILDLTTITDVKKVLFVCTGNTCRSPMAEGIFNHMTTEINANAIATSAGIFVMQASEVSENSRLAMLKEGIDISAHVSKQLSPLLMKEADLIFTMTRGHMETLKSSFPQFANKISTMAEYVGESFDVSDPFGGSLQTYELCLIQIKDLVVKILEKLK